MNKKLIFATVSVLILLILITVTVSAFQVDNSYSVLTSKPTSSAVQNMIEVFSLQQSLGFISADFEIVSISFDNDIACIILLASRNLSNISVSSSGSLRTYSGSTRSIIPYVWTSSGWSYPYNGRVPAASFSVYAQYHYYSALETSSASSYAGFSGLNPNSVFGSSAVSSSSVLSYYSEYSDRLLGYDNAVSESYSEGVSIGFDQGAFEGYTVGYDEGYNQGYDIGFDYGHDRGYAEGESAGLVEGESIGYQDGYTDGFDTGMDWGYQFGYQDGEATGLATGRAEGYSLGYSAGEFDGYESGYAVGRSDQSDQDDGPGVIQTRFAIKEDGLNKYLYRRELTTGSYEYKFAFSQDISSFDGWRIVIHNYETTWYISQRPETYRFTLPDFVSKNYSELNISDIVFTDTSSGNFWDLILSTSENYDQIFNDGHSAGYQDGISDADAIVDGISAITVKPIQALKDAFDFEIFGINVGAVVLGIVAICFLFFVYKFIRRLLPI